MKLVAQALVYALAPIVCLMARFFAVLHLILACDIYVALVLLVAIFRALFKQILARYERDDHKDQNELQLNAHAHSCFVAGICEQIREYLI